MHARPSAQRTPSRKKAARRGAKKPAASAARRARTRRAKRRRTGRAWLITASIVLLLLLGGAVIWGAGYALTSISAAFDDAFDSPLFDTARSSPPVPPKPVPPNIAGYGVEQLGNACTILTAGRDLGFDDRDQTIAVMTAMGESSLRNIDYGDWETSGVTNPDGSRTTSIGLFQQQDNWGTREERLDPYTSATLFYRAMAARVPDRAALEPTIVAHTTQINANPTHYARYWDAASRAVAAVSGTPLGDDNVDGIPTCPAG